MIDLQGLVNKTVDLRFRGSDIRLDLSHALFSSFDVDVGTKLLFKAIGRDEALLTARRILDAGCGVGVIGLAVAASLPDATVTLRDRDLLAVAFSERNRRRNKLANARVEAGLIGAGRGGGPWDYILSNVPAKAGAPVIRAFLAESRAALEVGGHLAIVVVKPLVGEIEAALGEAGFEIVAMERGSMHRAYVARRLPARGKVAPMVTAFPDDPLAEGAFDPTAYLRGEGEHRLIGKEYRARGFWGLPDFDTIGWPQLAATELLSRFATGSPAREVLVVNPGVGHAALWISLALAPERIAFASRDLLSLVAARENLRALAPAGSQGPAEDPEPSSVSRAIDVLRLDEEAVSSLDLIVDFADPIPEYDWLTPTWERSARLIRNGGTLVVAAPPTELFRLEKRRPDGWRLLGEKRKKGGAAAAWRRNS
jgi:predicted O-methyltransferase YrrM